MIWILKMAWRDGRAIFHHMLLAVMATAIGIAALVATNAVIRNVTTAVDENAKVLLGADLRLRSRTPFPETVRRVLATHRATTTEEIDFNSMAVFPGTGESRLVLVRAMEGGFPYYGEMVTEPAEAAQTFRMADAALVEEALFHQFGLETGDAVQIGRKTFRIVGKLIKSPGERMGSFFTAPRVLIPQRALEDTGLIEPGSLQRYRIHIHEPDAARRDALIAALAPHAADGRFRIGTVEEARKDAGENAEQVNRFFGLAGFVIVLLGGIGVAGAVHVTTQKKRAGTAILTCLGATRRQALAIAVTQAVCLGLVGAVAGAALGVAAQRILIAQITPHLPVAPAFALAWTAIGGGVLIGGTVSLLFSLLPLLALRRVSPAGALRAAEGEEPAHLDAAQKGVLVLLVVAVYLTALLYLRGWLIALAFVGGLILVLGLFWGTAAGLTTLLKKRIALSWPYPLRQGLANLYRPNNQTTLLMTCLGLGVFLILVTVLSHNAFLQKFSVAAGAGRPNMALFDIRTDKRAEVEAFIRGNGLPLLQSVPIVSMRLSHIKGVPVETLRDQEEIPGWTLRRQYRSTMRNTLNDNETVVLGRWHGGDPVALPPYPISLEERIAADLEVRIGDAITFDVAGRPVETRVASLRKVDWYQVQPTFFVIFPEGALAGAPQFHVATTHAPTPADAAQFQRAVAAAFPEVSVIDLRLVLDTVNQFLGKIVVAVRVVAGLVIVSGLLILWGMLTISRTQRRQETALLRALGAGRAQVLLINGVEVVSLGVLVVLTGVAPALAGSWAVTEVFLKSRFVVDGAALITTAGAFVLMTAAVSFLHFWPLLKTPPMEVLREE